MSNELTIFPEDDIAAKKITVTGWVSRNGHFYGDNERLARYDGSTHSHCQYCGSACTKNWTACDKCRHENEIKRYAAMPRKAWDGACCIYSEALDEYFSDPSDAKDSLEDGQTLADLRLIICEPNYIRPLESEYCSDEMSPDDDQLPPAVEEAMKAFNEAIKGIALSWSPGKFALLLPPDEASA